MKQKGSIIEKYVHNHSEPINIRLDRDLGEFHAEFEGVTVKDKTLDGVREQLRKATSETHAMEWQAMIEVSPDRSHGTYEDSVNLGLSIQRLYIARRRDGTYTQARWKENRDVAAKGNGSFNVGGHESTDLITLPVFSDKTSYHRNAYLPYTEDLWVALQTLVLQLQGLRICLEKMTEGQTSFDRMIVETQAVASSLIEDLDDGK